MADLPGTSNLLQKVGNAFKQLANKAVSFARNTALVMTPGGVPAKINSEANLLIQERRELMQLEQMKLSWVQHQENLELKNSLEENRQAVTERLAQLNHQRSLEIQKMSQKHQRELEEYRATVQATLQEKGFDFQKWKLLEEKRLQFAIVNLRHELDLEIAKYNRETALNHLREQRRLSNSPINLVSDDLLESPYSNGDMPLRILLSPPELNSDNSGQKSLGFKVENYLAEEIREFIAQNYSFNGEQRQTQLLDGAWVSKKFRGGAGIQALHSQLKAVPTLVLESEADSNYLNFRVAYWRGDGSEPLQQSILSKFPYQDFLYESARERAKEWQKTKEKLVALGKSPEKIKMMGGDNDFNLFILHEEQELIEEGIDVSGLDIQKKYKLRETDFQKLHQYLVTFHCLSVGLIADLHYLHRDNLIPLLPSLLPELLENLPYSNGLQESILDWLIPTYDSVYKNLEEVMASWIPELRIQFALALSNLEEKTYAKEQGEESVKAWLRTRGIEDYTRKLLKNVVTKDDKSYFESLGQFVASFQDERDCLVLMKRLLEDWLLLEELDVIGNSPKISEVIDNSRNKNETIDNRYDKNTVIFESQKISEVIDNNLPKKSPGETDIEDLKQEVREMREKNSQLMREVKDLSSQRETDLLGERFSFEVVTVNNSGEIITRETKTNRQQVFDLGGGVKLDMVYIPGGEFTMGAPKSEEGSQDDERPQHRVTIKPFFMGKFLVTQAQWQAVASLPRIKRDLDPNPSIFKGDNLPVGRVSWHDAVEFCARLSRYTLREYRLPSEAQWEYACRAGTTTPFYFGGTITTDLANYNGTDWEYEDRTYSGSYGAGPKGEDRLQTTPVGSFPPNGFGLHDMHGNVWEWCADHWHDNYEGAPTDGSPRLDTREDDNGDRLLRGGSWSSIPDNCRSADRTFNLPDDRDSFIGFRVCCGIPRT